MHAISFSLKAILVTSLLLAGSISTALAQGEDTLDVSTSGMTVTAQFTRSTPCAPYELAWGDGEEEVVEEIDEICIQVIDEKTLRHEYEEAGEYTVTLTLGGETYTEAVEVPAEEVTFGIDDVATITAKWVDPFEIIADEEYYIYTIKLDTGEVVTVEAGGFTPVEYRNQQFVDAGYTGDVDDLLAMVEHEEPVDPEPVYNSENDRADLYQQLRTALVALIERLQSLLLL